MRNTPYSDVCPFFLFKPNKCLYSKAGWYFLLQKDSKLGFLCISQVLLRLNRPLIFCKHFQKDFDVKAVDTSKF